MYNLFMTETMQVVIASCLNVEYSYKIALLMGCFAHMVNAWKI